MARRRERSAAEIEHDQAFERLQIANAALRDENQRLRSELELARIDGDVVTMGASEYRARLQELIMQRDQAVDALRTYGNHTAVTLWDRAEMSESEFFALAESTGAQVYQWGDVCYIEVTLSIVHAPEREGVDTFKVCGLVPYDRQAAKAEIVDRLPAFISRAPLEIKAYLNGIPDIENLWYDVGMFCYTSKNLAGEWQSFLLSMFDERVWPHLEQSSDLSRDQALRKFREMINKSLDTQEGSGRGYSTNKERHSAGRGRPKGATKK